MGTLSGEATWSFSFVPPFCKATCGERDIVVITSVQCMCV